MVDVGLAMNTVSRPRSERTQIETYVRNRLLKECKRYGMRSRIARIIGFNPSHITNVLHDMRGAGELMTRRLAAHWGMTYGELEQAALGIPADPDRDKLPNLRLTLEWCREGYPAEFLRVYEQLARKAKQDRPRRDWLDDIDRQLRNWARGVGIQPSVTGQRPLGGTLPDAGPPLPEPAPRRPRPSDGEPSKVRKKLQQSLEKMG